MIDCEIILIEPNTGRPVPMKSVSLPAIPARDEIFEIKGHTYIVSQRKWSLLGVFDVMTFRSNEKLVCHLFVIDAGY